MPSLLKKQKQIKEKKWEEGWKYPLSFVSLGIKIIKVMTNEIAKLKRQLQSFEAQLESARNNPYLSKDTLEAYEEAVLDACADLEITINELKEKEMFENINRGLGLKR